MIISDGALEVNVMVMVGPFMFRGRTFPDGGFVVWSAAGDRRALTRAEYYAEFKDFIRQRG